MQVHGSLLKDNTLHCPSYWDSDAYCQNRLNQIWLSILTRERNEAEKLMGKPHRRWYREGKAAQFSTKQYLYIIRCRENDRTSMPTHACNTRRIGLFSSFAITRLFLMAFAHFGISYISDGGLKILFRFQAWQNA
jgi:hypothetical protein